MFTPINKAHAIVEAVVFVEFIPDLSGSMTSLHGLIDQLKDELPASELQPMVRIELTAEGGHKVATAPAMSLTLRRVAPNAMPLWMMQVGPSAISVHCLDYTRWATVWPTCNKYLAHAFKALGAAPVDVSAVGLKVIDRFLYEGAVSAYDASKLFRRDSSVLHGRAFNSGARWHCHTGWFDQLGRDSGFAGREVLNQLNCDSGMNLIEGQSRVVVTVDHTMMLRRGVEGGLAEFALPSEGTDTPLHKLMGILHNGNKRVLAEALTEQMAKTIALNAEAVDVYR